MLNLPIMNELESKDNKNILIAGAGGGFDVFAGLPLTFSLNAQGYNCVLFNYSFTDLPNAKSDNTFNHNNILYGFEGKVTSCPKRKDKNYFPEGYLSEHMNNIAYTSGGATEMVYASPKIGVAILKKAYEQLIEKENIGTIILVDGGVDSLMQGDETYAGTILEDTVSLAAIKDLKVKKILATIGFGTELDDGLDHYFVLNNMSELIKQEALKGSCCLTKSQRSFYLMKNAYDYVVRQDNHATSHITPRIIKAVEGEFGAGGNFISKSYVDGKENHQLIESQWFIQPLMNIYWFWDVDTVIKNNKLITKEFCRTNTFTDVNIVHRLQKQEIIERIKLQDKAILF